MTPVLVTIHRMNFRQLRPDQAEALGARIRPMLRYLNHLTERMTRRGFPADDPLYVTATKARAAMQDLHMSAHYASCEHGVGRAVQRTHALASDQHELTPATPCAAR
jgi:hypothetical protein